MKIPRNYKKAFKDLVNFDGGPSVALAKDGDPSKDRTCVSGSANLYSSTELWDQVSREILGMW